MILNPIRQFKKYRPNWLGDARVGASQGFKIGICCCWFSDAISCTGISLLAPGCCTIAPSIFIPIAELANLGEVLPRTILKSYV